MLSTLSEANIQNKHTDIMSPSSNDPAEARKRRKEIIQSQRSENESIANGVLAAVAANGSAAASASPSNGTDGKHVIVGAGADVASDTATDDASGNGAEKKPPKKRKVASGDPSSRKISKTATDDESDAAKAKKTQIRYDPDVPMSKDQLAAWRREARRVRNRESAAASRQRIRNRISELEDEVGDWKAKYSHAIRRLEALEQCISAKADNNGAEQICQQQDLMVLPGEQEQPVAQAGAPAVAPAEGTKYSPSAI